MMELRSPSGAFLEIAKTWHEDVQYNRDCGFSPGGAGQVEAQAALDLLVTDPPPDARLLAIWEGTTPIGHAIFTDIAPKDKSGDLHIAIAPAHQGKGFGKKAIREATEFGFKEGLYRITFKPAVYNKRAIEAALKAGYKIEARTKASIWTIHGPQDQAQMRAIKPEWVRRKRN
jgi:RimJ/RimL family protein N-acetyltransferase